MKVKRVLTILALSILLLASGCSFSHERMIGIWATSGNLSDAFSIAYVYSNGFAQIFLLQFANETGAHVESIYGKLVGRDLYVYGYTKDGKIVVKLAKPIEVRISWVFTKPDFSLEMDKALAPIAKGKNPYGTFYDLSVHLLSKVSTMPSSGLSMHLNRIGIKGISYFVRDEDVDTVLLSDRLQGFLL